MEFKSVEEIQEFFRVNKYEGEVHDAIEFLLKRVNGSRNFLGKEITDFYCNGFFGRRYDLNGSKITEVGSNYIIIQDTESNSARADFEEGWQLRDMYSLLEDWTA